MTLSSNQHVPSSAPSADSFTATPVLTRSDLQGFLLRELSATDRAVTTSELRCRAGQAGYPATLVTAVYPCLRAMENCGRVSRVSAQGRLVYWAAAKPGSHPAAAIERRLSS